MNGQVAVFVKPAPVDVARLLRDLAAVRSDMRRAIGQVRDIQDVHQLWLVFKADELEGAHLTDLAAAKLEKYLEQM